jgi:hypothetical protein
VARIKHSTEEIDREMLFDSLSRHRLGEEAHAQQQGPTVLQEEFRGNRPGTCQVL